MKVEEINGHKYSKKVFDGYQLRVKIELITTEDSSYKRIITGDVYTTETDKKKILDYLSSAVNVDSIKAIRWFTKEQDEGTARRTKEAILAKKKEMNKAENTKLIAEFMGIDKTQTDELGTEFINPPFGSRQKYYSWDDIAYNSSWEWLMPVVEKIEELGYSFEINRTDYAIRLYADKMAFVFSYGELHTKKEAVYKGTIEFINWYNNENKKS